MRRIQPERRICGIGHILGQHLNNEVVPARQRDDSTRKGSQGGAAKRRQQQRRRPVRLESGLIRERKGKRLGVRFHVCPDKLGHRRAKHSLRVIDAGSDGAIRPCRARHAENRV